MLFFFFNDTATTEIYTLSLHDALPISVAPGRRTQYGFFKAAGDEVVLKRALVLEILLGPAARHLVERRLRDEEMAAVDDLAHLAIEESQEQGADVSAVHVGVGHDADFVIAQLISIELVADAGAERGDQRADFLA